MTFIDFETNFVQLNQLKSKKKNVLVIYPRNIVTKHRIEFYIIILADKPCGFGGSLTPQHIGFKFVIFILLLFLD